MQQHMNNLNRADTLTTQDDKDDSLREDTLPPSMSSPESCVPSVPTSPTSPTLPEAAHWQAGNSYRQRILRVLLYMEENIGRQDVPPASGRNGDRPGAQADPLSLETLAAVAHLSPFHFHRVFTGMVGESVKAYLRRLRLERASTMLAFTDHAILDVALEAGYESQEAFTRAFRARFGASPAQYRRSGCRLAPENPYIKEIFMPANTRFNPQALGLDVEIKHLPAQRVAAVRHVGPYSQCDSAWSTLCGWAAPKGLLGPGVLFLGICHDDPTVTDPDKIRYDACIAVSDTDTVEGPASALTLRGGDYVVAVHKGPYENLYKSYAAICGQWIPLSGREMAMEPSIEVYLTDPKTTPPGELRTEIRIPLVPAA